MLLMKITYLANILVAGWVGVSCLFFPKTAISIVFENTLAYSESIKIVGALWCAIFLISILGLFFPKEFQIVFLVQLIYKSLWLVVVAIPAIQKGLPYPYGMAVFFLVWVIILPFVIDWKQLFGIL